MAQPNWQIVEEILTRTEGQDNGERALEIVAIPKLRTRELARKREEFSHLTAQIAREATGE
jgi:hypothetical protein